MFSSDVTETAGFMDVMDIRMDVRVGVIALEMINHEPLSPLICLDPQTVRTQIPH